MREAFSDHNCLGSNRVERHWSCRFSFTGLLIVGSSSFFLGFPILSCHENCFLLILQYQLSGELEALKAQLNDASREREALKADKEQEREKRKNTEKELRQVTFMKKTYFGQV